MLLNDDCNNNKALDAKNSRKDFNDYYSLLIVKIAQEKSKSAFQELYLEFFPRIKSFLRSLKVEYEALDDLSQDVMVTIWRKAHQYDAEKSAPVTWIFTITRNRFIDTHIRKRKHNLTEQDASFFMSDADNPFQNLERINQYQIIKDAIKNLPPEQNDLIKMAYFYEKTHVEIAHETKLPLGTIKSRLRIALNNLRKHIGIKKFTDC